MTTTAAPAPEMTAVPLAVPPRTVRLVSLDVLRGFDMFWIIGAEEIVHDIARLFPSKWTNLAAWQMSHSEWVGFHFYDLIFPMFIFIVGVSLVFSLTKAVAVGGRSRAIRRVVIRGLVLYAFGIMYYGGFSKHFQDIRLLGVLQRIAICYLVSGLLFCLFRPRVLLGVAIGLLVIYWALLTFVKSPGQAHVSFDEGRNLTNWIDSHYLPFFKWDGDHDPEGILSTLPAIAGCLLGVFAGLLLRNNRPNPYLKVLILLFGGAALVGLGTLWGMQFPVIKKLWTSSFVLVTAGYSAALLGLFYLIVDVWKLRFWTAPFVWIGMNAITLYLMWRFVSFTGLASRVVGGQFGAIVFHRYETLAVDLLALIMILAVGRFLYRRQIFLRV